MLWLVYFCTAALAYLLGAIPVGMVIVKLISGTDIREHGSGKTGATNVLRTLGWAPAVATLLGDIVKGSLGVLIGRLLSMWLGADTAHVAEVVGAIAAIVGHNWPIYIGGRGGRGVATTLGAVAVLSPLTAALALPVALVTIVASDMASLGSLLGTLVGLAMLVLFVAIEYHPPSYAIFALVAGGLIVFQHRDNVGRLVRGQERKLGIRKRRTAAIAKGDH